MIKEKRSKDPRCYFPFLVGDGTLFVGNKDASTVGRFGPSYLIWTASCRARGRAAFGLFWMKLVQGVDPTHFVVIETKRPALSLGLPARIFIRGWASEIGPSPPLCHGT